MENIHKTKSLAIMLAALIFLLMLIPAGSAAITVKEGDWAKYKIEAELPDEGLGVELPFNEVEWMKIEVKSVSDTNVTVDVTLRFKNGTELAETIDGMESSLIIDTAITNNEEGAVAFSGLGFFGGLLPGDSVSINGTESRTYAGATREVQYAGIQMGDSTASISWKLYWDKTKGVLCELSMITSADGSTMSLLYKMIETNMWGDMPASEGSSGEGFWMLPVFGVVAVVGVVGFAVLLWRRKRISSS